MKRIFLLIGILLTVIKSAKTQNLVIDGDFEKYIVMPGVGQGSNMSYYLHYSFNTWYKVNSSAGYYYNVNNVCSWNSLWNTSQCGVPYHGDSGFQYPRSGKGYASLDMGSNKTYLNFIGNSSIGGTLKQTLQKNIVYCGGYYLNLFNNSYYYCNGYGMAFTKEKIDTGINSNPNYYVHLDYLNYGVKSPTDFFISDTLNWIQVADTFVTKSGSEKFFVISNFLPRVQIQFNLSGNSHSGSKALYYIDDVFVYEQKPIWVYDGDVTICDTITYVLRAEQAPEFVWWNINNPNVWLSTRDTLALPPGVGGTYVVRGEACGYVTYDTVTVTRLNCGLGMPGQTNDDDLATIFPNPASTAFTLKLAQETHTGGTLYISDVNGRQLANHRITQSNQNIGTAQLAPGIYALAYEHKGQMLWRGKLCVVR
jgi:hypothetical protein